MVANLSAELGRLSADQLSTVDYEAGLSASLASVPDSFAHALDGPGAPVFAPGAGASLSVGFSSSTPAQAFTASEMDSAWQALQLWSGLTDVTFTHQPNASAAAIDFVHAFDSFHGQPLGQGTQYTPLTAITTANPALDDTRTALVQIDDVTKASDGITPGYGAIDSYTVANGYGIDTLVHELGHLVGLGHTGPYNGSIDPSTQQRNPTDVRTWSIMSYIDPVTDMVNANLTPDVPKYASLYPVQANFGGYYPSTPMGLDLIAAQRLDGAPTSRMFAGNTVFGFNSNITYTALDGTQRVLSMYNFAVDTHPVVTLFDYGTNNTLDVSGFAAAAALNLNDGTFSSVAGLTNNLFIEWGTQIDHAIGGGGNDVFTLNQRGDVVDGGGGSNTAVLPGARADYTLGYAGSAVILTQISTGVVNQLSNIQSFQFSDATLAAAALPLVQWIGGADSDYATAANWSDNQVPGATSVVTIGAGDAVGVSQPGTVEISSLTLQSQAALDIGAGSFIVDNPASDSSNDGTITVEAGATLELSGTLTNTGTVTLNGGAGYLLAGASGLTLAGGGTIQISQGDVIGGGAIDNVDSVITGAGTIGASGAASAVTVHNEALGTVAATAGVLVISAATVNDGTLSAQGGTLDLKGSVDQTGGGGITAWGAGSGVLLDGGTITAGTLSASNGGTIEVAANTSLSGVMTITGTVTVDSGAMLTLVGDQMMTLQGSVANAGSIVLGGAANGPGATLALSGTATLSGGGSVTLAGGRVAGAGGSADGLDNVDNTIVGAGQIGQGTMTLANGAAGAIEATTGTLTLDTGGSAIANNGLLEATGAGTLVVDSAVTNSGVVEADAGGTVVLTQQASGTLKIGSNATLVLQAGAAAGATVDFTGTDGALKLVGAALGQPFNLTILHWAPGDTIDLAGIVATQSSAGGVATLSTGAVALGAITARSGSASFSAAPDGHSGTLVTTAAPDPLFDPAYYLAQNTDVAAAGVDPYQHYMTTGWKEGRNPDALFNTRYYLNQNPDVAAAGVNPLTHFETYGWHEGRDPSVLFSVTKYDATYTDVAAAGVDPLEHYIEHGKAEGRTDFAATPHATGVQDPAVDYAYYYAQHPAVAAAGLDASADYHSTGWALGYNPNAYFDTNYYLTQNPDVKAAGVDPLTHFETYGWLEGRAPSLVFSDSQYLATYTDVAAAGVDPLVHYLDHGISEGRMSFIAGGTAAADPLVNAAYYDQQLGATLIPAGAAGQQQAAFSYDATGWQKGLNPDALFDTNYYLSHNPDVAAAHVDPLQHYETYGWREGRDPSAQFSTNKYLGAYADVKAANLDPLLHYVEYGQGEGRAAFHV